MQTHLRAPQLGCRQPRLDHIIFDFGFTIDDWVRCQSPIVIRQSLLGLGVGIYVGSDLFFEPVEDFAGFGVAAQGFLGEEGFAVDFEFKGALGAGDEGETVDDMLIIGQDIGRRPDGAFTVVSRYAVFEGDFVFRHVDLHCVGDGNPSR